RGAGEFAHATHPVRAPLRPATRLAGLVAVGRELVEGLAGAGARRLGPGGPPVADRGARLVAHRASAVYLPAGAGGAQLLVAARRRRPARGGDPLLRLASGRRRLAPCRDPARTAGDDAPRP